jgi:hypothetical protein
VAELRALVAERTGAAAPTRAKKAALLALLEQAEADPLGGPLAALNAAAIAFPFFAVLPEEPLGRAGQRTFWTRSNKERFLSLLVERGGNIKRCCAAMPCSRSGLYALLEEEPEFANAVDTAQRRGRSDRAEDLEDDLYLIAKDRTAGERVRAITILLKANAPERYRDRMEISGDPSRPVKVEKSRTQEFLEKVTGGEAK